MRYLIVAAGSMLIGLAPAFAAPLQLSGRADARAGYGTNPFLREGRNGQGGPVLGFNIAPTLKRVTDTGQTSLIGNYSREQYFNGEGHPDSLEVALQQLQQFSPDLSVTATASYSSSINALNNTIGPILPDAGSTAQDVVDPLTIGSRTRRYQGNASFVWRATNVDTIQGNAGYTHGLSNGGGLSNYSFYNAGIGYSRAIGGRTQIGARIGYSRTESGIYPTTTSYEPSLLLVHQFSEIWTFNGSAGVAIRRTPGTNQKSVGPGFDLSLCGTYPTTSVCVTTSRVTSASGFGGARINTSFGVRASHQLNARDSIRMDVGYTNSDSAGGPFASGQQFTRISGSFDHKLSTRWIVGADGRFQSRVQDRLGDARAINATLHLAYLFGRVG